MKIICMYCKKEIRNVKWVLTRVKTFGKMDTESELAFIHKLCLKRKNKKDRQVFAWKKGMA